MELKQDDNGWWLTEDGLKVPPFEPHEFKRGSHRQPFSLAQEQWMKAWLGVLNNKELEVVMNVGYKTIQKIRKDLGIRCPRQRGRNYEQPKPEPKIVSKPAKPKVKRFKREILTDEEKAKKEERLSKSKRYAGFDNWHKGECIDNNKKSVCIASCWCKTIGLCSSNIGSKCDYDLANKFYKKYL